MLPFLMLDNLTGFAPKLLFLKGLDGRRQLVHASVDLWRLRSDYRLAELLPNSGVHWALTPAVCVELCAGYLHL
jgi:hypothetical protein